MGRLSEHRWSAPLGRVVVSAYCRAYDIALDDYVVPDAASWDSFDSFFTRSLREGARAVEGGDDTLVSPADGRLDSIGPVDRDATFLVKGRPYRVGELVGSDEEAKRYEGGAGCVIYLSPRDYHRVHTPVSGKLTAIRSLPGDYYPVNSLGIDHVKNLFAINRRVAITIDESPDFGRVSLVMVAAMIVGRITARGVDARDVPLGEHALSESISKGEELGVFHLGSTVVMFFEPRREFDWLVREGPVRMGQGLARILKKKKGRP